MAPSSEISNHTHSSVNNSGISSTLEISTKKKLNS